MSCSRIHHLNCGTLQAPGGPRAGCHCLLIEDNNGLTLVDTGIGLLDVQQPEARIGQALIDLVGFQFDERETAIRQIEQLGFSANDVKHIVLTHGDPDHAGGLADFPNALVHISDEELANISAGSWRYLPIQFAHQPRWRAYAASNTTWFGLKARPLLDLNIAGEILLIELFGHTHGHCGVAIQQGYRWELHVGDAYYLRVELDTDDHSVSQLAAQRADSDQLRRQNIEQLRRLVRDHSDQIRMFGYHDLDEAGG